MSSCQQRIDAQIDLRAALAKHEIRQMTQSAMAYINASAERYNRSAAQSLRQWKLKNKQ
jgi:hypothetical protein